MIGQEPLTGREGLPALPEVLAITEALAHAWTPEAPGEEGTIYSST